VSELLLGIDIGTYSSKGVLCTPDGDVVAQAQRPHRPAMPRPGWVEHDAEGVWWSDFVSISSELLAQAGSASVAGLCVSGIGPCVLPLGDRDEPLRPAILYGIDTRALEEIDELSARYGADEILERCGSPLTSQAVGPKLLWLRRKEPQVWARTRRFAMASSFVLRRLTGEYVLDHHSASQCDPLYDLDANAWIREWAEDIAPGMKLPELMWPGEVVGTVTAAAAEKTGLPVGLPVAAGTIDAWAEATSVDVKEPGDLMLMYGTTMFIVSVLTEVRPHPKLWSTAGVFPDVRNIAAGMATSGALTEWFRALAGSPSYEELLKDAAEVPSGSGGLVVLPYFSGERTPLFDTNARGVVCGLTLSHGRGHLYRALLESTAFGVRHNLQAIGEAGGLARRVVAVGGGTKGDLWTQIVSDVAGVTQQIPAQTVGASYGDCFLAGVATGLVDSNRRWNKIVGTVEPVASDRDLFDRMYGIYLDLYQATIPHAHALADLQAGH
jgi:xylulokinase